MSKFVYSGYLFVIFFCAAQAFAHEGLEQQIAEASALIAQTPSNAELYLKRARLYRLHEEFQKSHADIKKAAEISPELKGLNAELGYTFFAEGSYKKAANVLKKVVTANRSDYPAQLTYARALGKIGDPDTAFRHFKIVEQLSPNESAEIYFEAANVLRKAKRFSQALTHLKEGISRHGNLIYLERAALECETALKRFKDALTRLKSIQDQFRKEEYAVMRGEFLLKFGDQKAACSEFNAAAEIFNEMSDFRRKVPQNARLEARLKTGFKSCN